MAINTSSSTATVGVEQRVLVAPQSLSSQWQDCLTAVTALDGSTITLSSSMDNTTHYIINAQVGSTVLLRMKYPSDLTVTTPPTVAVFGLDQIPGPNADFSNFVLQPLYSADGNLSETLSVSVRDTQATIGANTWKWTVPNPEVHAWDRLGSAYIVVGITTALTSSTGNPDASTIEYKVI